MQSFRGFVIGTLNFVCFLAFFAIIVAYAYGGYTYGQVYLANVPQWAAAVIGGVLGYLIASIVIGIIFTLIDIQDGIRDLNRLVAKQGEKP